MEEWKSGMVEEWGNSAIRQWKIGRMEEWKIAHPSSGRRPLKGEKKKKKME